MNRVANTPPLLAAARAMLAALEEVREYFDDADECMMCGSDSFEDGHDDTCPTKRIDAAIAQAKGGGQ